MPYCGQKQVIHILYAKVNDSCGNDNNNADNGNKQIPQFVFYSGCVASSSAVLMEGCRNNFWLTPNPHFLRCLFLIIHMLLRSVNIQTQRIGVASHLAILLILRMMLFHVKSTDFPYLGQKLTKKPWNVRSIHSNFWQTRWSSVKTQATNPG